MITTILLHQTQRTKFEKASLLVSFTFDDVLWSCLCPSLQLKSKGVSIFIARRQMVLQMDQFAQKCHLHGNLEARLNDLGWMLQKGVCTFPPNETITIEGASSEEYIDFVPDYLFNVNE
jgi:hypothetical protein